MPLPPIVVDVAQAEQKPAMAQALLDACSRAAGPATCVTPSQADEEDAFAIAIVVWLDNGDSVRVQVGLRRGEHRGEWLTRRVQFEPSDDESERWTATGFVVGTLAGRFVEDQEAPQHPTPARPPAPPAPPPAATPKEPPHEPPPTPVVSERTPTEFSTSLGALARPQYNKGPWGFGSVLRLDYRPEAWPVFFDLGLRATYRQRDRYGVVSYFGDGDLGLGVTIARLAEDWQLSGAWSVALQRMLVQARSPTSGDDRGSSWLGGARARFEVDWMPARWVGGFVSLGGVWWWKTVDIEVKRVVVEQQPAVLGEAALGLRLRAL